MLVVIPMAGMGSRFSNYGFKTNKYLLPIDSRHTPMIYKAINTLNLSKNIKFIFIIRRDQEQEVVPILSLLNLINFEIKIIEDLTDGPASTVYGIKDSLNTDEPLIISNSDQILEWSSEKFLKTSEMYDGCVLTYTPDYELFIGDTDKHSFIQKDGNDKIIRVEEKLVLSHDALVGVHYYKHSKYFIEAYEHMFSKNKRAPNGEFYISNTYQSLIELGYNIGFHKMGLGEKFHPTGEPHDYFKYLKKKGWKLDDHDFGHLPIKFINKLGHYNLSGIIGYTEGPKYGLITYVKDFYIEEGESCVFIKSGHLFPTTHISSFIKGWFIGNFQPSIYMTSEYEVGILHRSKDDIPDFHYHKLVTEYNVFVSGSMEINGEHLIPGQKFILDKNQISCCLFHEDTTLICVKIPSEPSDKYLI